MKTVEWVFIFLGGIFFFAGAVIGGFHIGLSNLFFMMGIVLLLTEIGYLGISRIIIPKLEAVSYGISEIHYPRYSSEILSELRREEIASLNDRIDNSSVEKGVRLVAASISFNMGDRLRESSRQGDTVISLIQISHHKNLLDEAQKKIDLVRDIQLIERRVDFTKFVAVSSSEKNYNAIESYRKSFEQQGIRTRFIRQENLPAELRSNCLFVIPQGRAAAALVGNPIDNEGDYEAFLHFENRAMHLYRVLLQHKDDEEFSTKKSLEAT